VLVEQFIASHERPPEEVVLDIDASDVPLHGEQESHEFYAYYDHHCYLPLYVFCGRTLLAYYLRRIRIDAARHAAAVMRLLVDRLRQAWLVRSGIHAAHIDPGKPWQNGTDESFNGKFRGECLSVEWFRSREEARVIIEQWRRHYNHVRPHPSLEYLTPIEFKLRYDSTTAGAISRL